MRYKVLLLSSMLLAAAAYGKEPKAYQSGQLLQMDAVSCAPQKTQAPLCQEYVLQTEKVDYRIRSADAKHAVLLPVGERAQFSLAKDKMRVRVESLDNKEREYVVISMKPRSESTAEARPVRLNHLQ